MTFKKMTDICGYLYWADLDGKELKFEVSEFVSNYCDAAGDSKLYGVSYGVPELWQLGSFEFLSKLISISNSLQSNNTDLHHPKFMHYASHAETLAMFFDGLGIHRVTRSPPASALFIEFLKENDEYYVRMYFNPD